MPGGTNDRTLDAIIEHKLADLLNSERLQAALARRRAVEQDALDVQTWPGRIKAAWVVLNQPGGLAIALVAVGLLLYTGYLPSVVTRIEAQLSEHRSDVGRLVVQRSQEQVELIGALKRLTEEIGARNRRDKLRECAEIRDGELRRECLR
jgi:hypothetical protein